MVWPGRDGDRGELSKTHPILQSKDTDENAETDAEQNFPKSPIQNPKLIQVLLRQNGSGLLADALIVLRAAVVGEVEDSVFVGQSGIEVAAGDDQLIADGAGFGDDFAGGGDDTAIADEVAAFFPSGFGDADDPGTVLVRAGLHRQQIVKVVEVVASRIVGIVLGRVVAEQHHFDALQTHDAVGFGPAAIVADAHANDAAKGSPHIEAQVAHFEVALFEVLKGAMGFIFGVTRQVDFAVLADDAAFLIH